MWVSVLSSSLDAVRLFRRSGCHVHVRECRIPPQYGQELSKGVTDVVGYAVFLHLLVSIWAYSQQDIFTLVRTPHARVPRRSGTCWTLLLVCLFAALCPHELCMFFTS